MGKKKKLLSANSVLKLWESLPRSEQYSANAKRYAKMAGLRSILEVRTQSWLESNKIPFKYEAEKLVYEYEPATYTPDFKVDYELDDLPVLIECKGKLTKEIRKKMLAIIACNPHVQICMVFEKPENKINRGSKTTYAEWAEKHGIYWSAVVPDKAWFKKGKKNVK